MTTTEIDDPTVTGTTEPRQSRTTARPHRPVAVPAPEPMKPRLATWLPWAPLPIRLVLGAGFIYHGAPKLFTAEGHQQFAGMLQGLGIPLPDIMAWVVGLVETAGGAALILGAFVAIASSLLIVNMVVAMVTVHLPHGFSFINQVGTGENGPIFGMPGYEVNLLYIAGLAALVLGGAGAGSLDGPLRGLFTRRTPRYVSIRARPPGDTPAA